MVKARAQAPITTTAQLARIVESVLPRKGRQHPGTRTFQALRIAVNGELDALDALLDSSVRLLGQGAHGRHHLPQPGRPQGQAVFRPPEPSGNRPPGMAGTPPQPGLLLPPAFPQTRHCGRRRTFNQPPFPQRQVARRGKNHLTISLPPPP